MEICLPLRFPKKSNKKAINWFTDIDIRRYHDDMRLLPTNNSVDIYQYSKAQKKYLPEKSVKKLLKTMLYSNKPVYFRKKHW